MFLGWSIDEIQSTMKKGNCGSFFLQMKALGPSQTFSPYNKKNENDSERTPKNIHSMERWIAQWNGANVLLSRSESLKQSRQHDLTWNSLRKWRFLMAFYSIALGDYVTPLKCEKGLFRDSLGLWPAYHVDSTLIWGSNQLGSWSISGWEADHFNICVI